MADLGAPELLIILVVVILVFGGSRVADLGGSLGKGIKEFKNAMKEEDEPSKTQTTVEASTTPAAVAAPAPAKQTLTCSACGTTNALNAVFCNECGNRLAGVQPTMAPQS